MFEIILGIIISVIFILWLFNKLSEGKRKRNKISDDYGGSSGTGGDGHTATTNEESSSVNVSFDSDSTGGGNGGGGRLIYKLLPYFLYQLGPNLFSHLRCLFFFQNKCCH